MFLLLLLLLSSLLLLQFCYCCNFVLIDVVIPDVTLDFALDVVLYV